MSRPTQVDQMLVNAGAVALESYELMIDIELYTVQISEALMRKPPNAVRAAKLNLVLNERVRQAQKRNERVRELINEARHMSKEKNHVES